MVAVFSYIACLFFGLLDPAAQPTNRILALQIHLPQIFYALGVHAYTRSSGAVTQLGCLVVIAVNLIGAAYILRKHMRVATRNRLLP